VNSVNALLRFGSSRLLIVGVALICIGGVGDIVYHSLPVMLSYLVEPLVGAEGLRAHLVTLIGMLVGVAGVIWRGLRR
jgi:hypothetical protein